MPQVRGGVGLAIGCHSRERAAGEQTAASRTPALLTRLEKASRSARVCACWGGGGAWVGGRSKKEGMTVGKMPPSGAQHTSPLGGVGKDLPLGRGTAQIKPCADIRNSEMWDYQDGRAAPTPV